MTTYGWKFPDGTVIPVEDGSAAEDKLLSMDSFWDRNRKDCLRQGLFYQWYCDDIERDIENMSERELYEHFGVRCTEDRDGRIVYVLPEGDRTDARGLFEWIEDEGYRYDEWLEYNSDCYDFKELVKNEAEYLTSDYGNEESMGYYGVKLVPMSSGSKRPSKPKAKSPAGKPAARSASKATNPKSQTSKRAVKGKAPAKGRPAPKGNLKGARR